MSYTVYALRLRGEIEARYIGQTQRALADRLHSHILAAKLPVRPRPLAVWLIENMGQIEVIDLAAFGDRASAINYERNAISLCAALGNRLFNIHGVPKAAMIRKDAA